MASTTTVSAIGRVHILHDFRMATGMPLAIGRRVTPAADRCSQFHPWRDRRVPRVGGVIGSRAVAILALNTGQLRCGGTADKSRRDSVTHSVARQTAGICALIDLL